MQTELVKSCPICMGTEFELILTCEDHTYSHKQFDIQKCSTCNLHITNPRPNEQSIGHYYQSPAYISHTGKSNNIFDFIYLKARSITLKWKYQLISKHQKKGIILDYGCGTGEFLSFMAREKWDVYGVEPSKVARDKAVKLIRENSKTIFEKQEDLPLKKFDVITLWHVLEHVPKPDELLTQLKSLLSNDGLIFVAVPNYESYDAQYYQRLWAGYDVPRHFWHFSQSSMQQLLSKQGLTVKQKVPMKLDAFYVSLLSEKHKNKGKHNLITPLRAFIRGIMSNAKGKKSLNYSSLIYIAHHA